MPINILEGAKGGFIVNLPISILIVSLSVCVGGVVVWNFIHKHIKSLSQAVRSSDPAMPITFKQTPIREINNLAQGFENLSVTIGESAMRVTKIMELVDISMGTFEVDYKTKRVIFSTSMFSLTDTKMSNNSDKFVSLEVWEDFLHRLGKVSKEMTFGNISESLYLYTAKEDTIIKWYKMRTIEELGNEKLLGVLIDATEEISQKQRLEYERNIDPLTRLLNRQSFITKASNEVLEHPKLVGVMMFADLDNLKFMNDTYGHEFGDRYIQNFAKCLIDFRDYDNACEEEYASVVGRISGDEFVAYLHGFKDKFAAKEAFDKLYTNIRGAMILSPDGVEHKIRVSVGLSYYPTDSNNITELTKFADYAMYEVKRTVKGALNEFDGKTYAQNPTSLLNNDIFKLFIEEERVQFAFQPIVDTQTGEIFGYEALMRPMMRELVSPVEVLQIARSQDKLYALEKMMYNLVLFWLSRHIHKLSGRKLFINSITNQVFKQEDALDLKIKYGFLFEKVVMEITENEYTTIDIVKDKIKFMTDFGAQIAVDNYGGGYTNDVAVENLSPAFIKIDMGLVRDIDRDKDRQLLIKNIVSYARKRGIKTIAKGVETTSEMAALVSFGVDYLQGFYLAKPKFELIDINEKARQKLLETVD